MLDFFCRLLGLPRRALVIPEGSIIVDVREPAEYAAGHVEGAINVPLSVLAGQVESLKKQDKVVVTYCRSGIRSAIARQRLLAGGLKTVINGKTVAVVNRALQASPRPD